MKQDVFNKIFNRRHYKVPLVLADKGKEYSGPDDRLYDFKKIAQLADVPVGVAWRVLNAKHLLSVYKMFDGLLEPTPELVDEKCGDEINYGYLGEALLNEVLEKKMPEEEFINDEPLLKPIPGDKLTKQMLREITFSHVSFIENDVIKVALMSAVYCFFNSTGDQHLCKIEIENHTDIQWGLNNILFYPAKNEVNHENH